MKDKLSKIPVVFLMAMSLISNGQQIDSITFLKLIKESKESHSDGSAIWHNGKTIGNTN